MVLVRHGQTEWSRSGRHTGRTDLPLTPEGRREAEELGKRLSGVSFARALTSPLRRARETCRLAGLSSAVEIWGELVEWDYGAYEGLTTSQIRATRPRWRLWTDGAPEGESPPDVGRRVDSVISSLRDGAGPAVVFAHGHVLRVFVARLGGLGRDGRVPLRPGHRDIERPGLRARPTGGVHMELTRRWGGHP